MVSVRSISPRPRPSSSRGVVDVTTDTWTRGQARQRRPLPISLADGTCAFRQAATGALAEAGLDWRTVCEESNMLSVYAALEADLAVAPMLRSTVPDELAVIDAEAGLPALPPFSINMYLPPAAASDVARELAAHIREQFLARYRPRAA